MSKNNIANNTFGISLRDSSENTISANHVTNNRYGIYLYDSSNNTIIPDNIFSDNNENIRDGSRTFKTPGFELILVVYTILFALFCKRNGMTF